MLTGLRNGLKPRLVFPAALRNQASGPIVERIKNSCFHP
ncbi:hypothetical protein [Polaromonas sp. CG9_12]|nr:hypothetical protein [Polaromonas sp. CG9_12]